MFKNLFRILIIIGLCIFIFYYGKENCKINIPEQKKEIKQGQKDLYQQFDRMFKDSSVWNSYDISPVKKIYRDNDLNNIKVTL